MTRKIKWRDSKRDVASTIDGIDTLTLNWRPSSPHARLVSSLYIGHVHMSIVSERVDLEEAIMDVRGQLADLCAPRVVGRFNDLLSRMSTWEAAA